MRKNTKISRRDFIRSTSVAAVGATLAGGSLVSGCSPINSGSNRHNVILISIDTLRADHLSCYGYERQTSPHIDKFAKESLIFTNAFSSAPSTLPSHMSLFTSVTPGVHGTQHRESATFSPLSPRIKTLPEILSKEGFRLYGYRGNPYQLQRIYGFGRGFPDTTDPKTRDTGYYGYRHSLLFDKHIYEMEKSSNPIFLFLHDYDVHASDLYTSDYIYDAPPEFRDKFLPNGEEIPFELDVYEAWKGKEKITAEKLEHIVARYDGGIAHVDHKMGDLFELLKQHDLYDNSLIILTSDHGETLGDRELDGVPQLDGHGGLYDIGLHVPLILKFPKGFKYNGPLTGKVDKIVRTIDVFPTVLDMLSIEPPSYIEGKSLLRIVRDRLVFASLAGCYSYRTPRYRVLVNGSSFGGGIEVYDLREDASEQDNLYAGKAVDDFALLQLAKETWEKKKSLGRILRGESQEVKQLDAETVEGLKALGYLD